MRSRYETLLAEACKDSVPERATCGAGEIRTAGPTEPGLNRSGTNEGTARVRRYRLHAAIPPATHSPAALIDAEAQTVRVRCVPVPAHEYCVVALPFHPD